MAAAAHWCILKTNRKLRRAIKFRRRERGLTYEDLCRLADVPKNKLSLYINNKKVGLSQEQIIRVAKELGILIELNVVLT